MKACLNSVYGSPDVMRLADIPKPVPKPNEVLIKILATSINGSDREGLAGTPLYARIGGLRKPGNPVLGGDIAGVVEAVGASHTVFNAGDAVFGELKDYHGGFAEYACSDGKFLAPKPDGLTFAQAAAIGQAGTIAWNGICKQGDVHEGQRVLINGAGGSGGSFSVQLAKLRGAEVTGVDSADKLEYVRSLGADYVLDYAQTDFAKSGEQYDLILDLIAHRPAGACARALRPGGRYAMVGGSMSPMLQGVFFGPCFKIGAKKTVGIMVVDQSRADMLAITELIEAGQIRISIDRVFAFNDIPDAMRHKAKGKVVIQIVGDEGGDG